MAATIPATFIACSWNSGTPSFVFFYSTRSSSFVGH